GTVATGGDPRAGRCGGDDPAGALEGGGQGDLAQGLDEHGRADRGDEHGRGEVAQLEVAQVAAGEQGLEVGRVIAAQVAARAAHPHLAVPAGDVTDEVGQRLRQL